MTPTELREARHQLGMTQAQLAVALGVSKTAVAMWERAERRMPPWMPAALDGLRWRRMQEAQL